MRKIAAATVLASSILFPALANAENLSFPTKVTAEKKVEIHTGATNAYPVIATVKAGLRVNVIKEFKNSAGEVWVLVDLENARGWANSAILTAQDYITISGYAKVNGVNVVSRKGPSNSYSAAGTLGNGVTVKVIDSFETGSGEEWYRVASGKLFGWIKGNFLTPIHSTASTFTAVQKTVYSSNTVVRSGASTSYSAVGKLAKNQKVLVFDSVKTASREMWYRVQSGKFTGWVSSTAFGTSQVSSSATQPIPQPQPGAQQPQPVPQPQPGAKPQPQPPVAEQTLIVGTHNTYLYAGATIGYRKMEHLPFKGKVTVLGEFVNSNKQPWERVQSSSRKIGWTPKTDLVQSSSNLTYLYATNNAVIRQGASSSYRVSAYLKTNDSLLVLKEFNGWFSVETTSGQRGWILKTQTSPSIILQGFLSPSTYTDGKANYLVWKKSSNFNFTYSTSANQLILKQGILGVELPSVHVPGIQSVTASGTTSKIVTITFAPGYTFTLRNYSDHVSIKVIPTGLAGKRIIVDAGHGGKDSGAIGPHGLFEKDVTLATALLVKSDLEKAGAIVTLTRGTDIFLELSQRTDIANSSNADAFISIHCDSYNATSNGTTTYYNTTVNFNGPRSTLLAQNIEKNLTSSLKTYNRGVKEQNFYVNRMNALPSVLVELAYISNPKEEALLRSSDFRQKAALGIKAGLEDYFSKF